MKFPDCILCCHYRDDAVLLKGKWASTSSSSALCQKCSVLFVGCWPVQYGFHGISFASKWKALSFHGLLCGVSQGVCIEHPTNNQKIRAPSPGRCPAASCNRCRTASNGHPWWVSSYAAINEGVIASVCWRLSLCLGNILTNVYVKWCHKYVTYMLQCPYKYKHNMQGFKRKTPNWPTLIYDSMYMTNHSSLPFHFFT